MNALYKLPLAAICLLATAALPAQDTLRWFDPATATFPLVDGRGWQDAPGYQRLPARAQRIVRPRVWDLSTNAAGVYMGFTTNSPTIVVRFTVSGPLQMPHMPATSVSGVDLYAKDANDSWLWARGRFHFGDTITYTFTNLDLNQPTQEFRLYLPLYNTVTWLQIGVPEKHTFTPLPASTEKPVVLYGTSILQGACASRPGLAWTNILGRKLDYPFINLGFSGNGLLEKEVIGLINEMDARLFVLDCMPNLHDRERFSKADVRQRIVTCVQSLRERHPQTPILLVQHAAGMPHTQMDTALLHKYAAVSQIMAETFAGLQKRGMKNLHLLTDEAIGLNMESTVDGTHPNDIGMIKYAQAYEGIIREILLSGN